jgi:hypothetical protein
LRATSSKSRLAVLAVLMSIAAAGCGGGSSSGGGSKAQLVAQADSICKPVAVQRATANTAVGKVSVSTTKELQLLARLAPPIALVEHSAVARLDVLKAPSSLSRDWQVLLSGIKQLADDTSAIATDAQAKNLKAVESITTSARTLREQLTTIATRDGFTYCGRDS